MRSLIRYVTRPLQFFPLSRLMATHAPSDWTKVAHPESNSTYDVFSKLPIAKSLLDNREYRYIRLPNNLEALLVSDPETDKAAAALDVGVGHLTDPDDLPGCAHFCEHLLFMGTKEYPSENEYSQFISSHGGSTNAYTSAFNTNYYFSVSQTSLSGALDRFSAFFKSPLFSASCTTRELNAVDSEHKKNLQNDTWRMFQLSKLLSRPDHPWRKFGSGNRESLLEVGKLQEKLMKENATAASGLSEGDGQQLLRPQAPSPTPSATSGTTTPADDGGIAGRETRRRLVEWWEQQYCASRMKLVLLGQESLDELTTMAVEKFSGVPNRGLPPVPHFDSVPFGPENEGIVAYAKTIMDFKAIEVVWSVPWQPPLYQYKPANFVSHFLGHEGPGSLHSYLKNKGWITYLSAGPSSGAPGFDFFKVTIVLTKEGLEHHSEVLSALYSYLALLRSSSSADLEEAQNEIIKLSDIFFRYREKSSSPSSYVSRLAERAAHPYPREKFLSAPSVTDAWKEDLVRELLSDYVTPRRGRVMVMAREGWETTSFTGETEVPIGSVKEWEKEKWYGTEYLVRRVPEHLLKQAEGQNDIPDLKLPRKNMFVPDDLEVEKKEISEPLKRPLKIRDTSMSSLWFKKDDRFWVPKANVYLFINSPLGTMTPKHNIASRLYVDLIRDSLTEFAYDADLAGLSYDVGIHSDGISVVLGGYNQKLSVLLEVVLKKVKYLEVNEDRFNVLKEQLRQEYENLAMEQPYHLSDYYARYLLSPVAWTPKEKLAELSVVTVDDIRRHIPEFLSRVFVNTLVHGNMAKDEAQKIVKLAEDTLSSRPLTASERITERSLLLPPASNHVFELPVPNKNDVNSALTYYLDIGDIADPETRATLGLFAHIASEPAFNQLRTVEQLGYIVSSSSWGSTGSIGWRIVVQSEKNPVYLENRVDEFFEKTLRPLLETMTDAEFEQKRKSLIQKKLEKFKNLGDESNSFWAHITSGYHDFMRRAIDAEILNTITREKVLALFMERIHPAAKDRAKLSIHMRAQGGAPASGKFSVAASEALLQALTSRGVVVEEEDYRKLSAAEPPLAAVKGFWTNHFKSLPDLKKETAQELLDTMDKLAAEHPTAPPATDDTGKLSDDVVHIRDMAAFKATLSISKAATPVEIYSDLDSRL